MITRHRALWSVAVVLVASLSFVFVTMLAHEDPYDPCTDYGPHDFQNEVDLCHNRTNDV
jgi:hypothetical protein